MSPQEPFGDSMFRSCARKTHLCQKTYASFSLSKALEIFVEDGGIVQRGKIKDPFLCGLTL